MQADVINAFTDVKDGDRVYLPGQVFEGAAARVAALEVGGYVARRAEKRQPAKRSEKKTAGK